jgi:succinate dehydrogenase / fumarate reductase, flavoprotein subunit
VDYNLMSTIPGLHVLGEANFSDHGANRLGASALMQGLADGYFIIPLTIGDYIASTKLDPVDERPSRLRAAERAVHERMTRLLGSRASARWIPSTASSARIMWDKCGMARNAAGLRDRDRRIPP